MTLKYDFDFNQDSPYGHALHLVAQYGRPNGVVIDARGGETPFGRIVWRDSRASGANASAFVRRSTTHVYYCDSERSKRAVARTRTVTCRNAPSWMRWVTN